MAVHHVGVRIEPRAKPDVADAFGNLLVANMPEKLTQFSKIYTHLHAIYATL
jgi:hypothetical protein